MSRVVQHHVHLGIVWKIVHVSLIVAQQIVRRDTGMVPAHIIVVFKTSQYVIKTAPRSVRAMIPVHVHRMRHVHITPVIKHMESNITRIGTIKLSRKLKMHMKQ